METFLLIARKYRCGPTRYTKPKKKVKFACVRLELNTALSLSKVRKNIELASARG